MNFILYALGKKFEEYRTCIDWNNVIAVSDKIDTYSSNEYPVPFVSAKKIHELSYDYILIFSNKYFEKIKFYLVGECNITPSKIISWYGMFPKKYGINNLILSYIRALFHTGYNYSLLDLGKIEMSTYYLTKGDITDGRGGIICGLDSLDANIGSILYDKVYKNINDFNNKFDFVIFGDVDEVEENNLDAIKEKTDCLVFASNYKQVLDKGDDIRTYLSKLGHVVSIASLEGIIWLVKTKYTVNPKRDVSIYVAMHKPFGVRSEYPYVPLCIGQYRHYKYISELNGLNISHLNTKINECTALYWIWKNTDSKYVGLNHYRRYFYRNDFISMDNFLDADDVINILEHYDIILPDTCFVGISVKEDIKKSINNMLFDDGYEKIRALIGAKQKDYLKAFDVVMNGHVFFPCNMFVTKRKIFNEYCEWLFSFLIEAAESIDVECYDAYSKRIMGFLAERMLTVWLWKNKLIIKQLPIAKPDD